MSIGGENLPDFVFDCNNTNNNGLGIQWSRQVGSKIFTQRGTYTGQRILLENIEHDDLDVYTCTDTFTGNSLSINITDGRLISSIVCVSECACLVCVYLLS